MLPCSPAAISVSITTSSSWVGNLIGTQIAPLLFESRLQLFGTFYLLAGINLLAFLFILLTLPETKARQLAVLQLSVWLYVKYKHHSRL